MILCSLSPNVHINCKAYPLWFPHKWQGLPLLNLSKFSQNFNNKNWKAYTMWFCSNLAKISQKWQDLLLVIFAKITTKIARLTPCDLSQNLHKNMQTLSRNIHKNLKEASVSTKLAMPTLGILARLSTKIAKCLQKFQCLKTNCKAYLPLLTLSIFWPKC